MYYQERHCDCDPDALQDSGVQIHNMAQHLVLFASVPLSKEGWHASAASQLIVVKHGKIVATRNLQWGPGATSTSRQFADKSDTRKVWKR